MSSAMDEDVGDSHARGLKRRSTTSPTTSPPAKSAKSFNGQTPRSASSLRTGPRPLHNEFRRTLTPEQKAHERAIKEKSKKYMRPLTKPKLQETRKRLKAQFETQQKQFKKAAESAARAEILHHEQAGFMEAENDMEATWKVKQVDIAKEVDLVTSGKIFSLSLPKFGPYCHAYSRNGRYLLLGGAKGHVALIDWQKNELKCELNLGENVRDVCFLHNETMFAVAQKKNVYIYDQVGTELHRLKTHTTPYRMTFLPYHFLLASTGREGNLRYQDTSTGHLVADLKTRLGPCVTLAQNPRNAVLHLGHNNGAVTLWAPKVDEPLVRMACHRSAVTAIVVDNMGRYMVTAGEDGCMKVWDLKSYLLLQTYYVKRPITQLSLSGTGLLALSYGCHLQVWKDFVHEEAKSPYMQHSLPEGGHIRSLAFCPFEDVLGIGHDLGFASIVVPGSGQAAIDTYAANPYETTKQRREATVQRLLDKIQPDMIVLDPDSIGTVTKSSEADYSRNVEAALAAKKQELNKAAENEAEDDELGVHILGAEKPSAQDKKPKKRRTLEEMDPEAARRAKLQAANRERTLQNRKERAERLSAQESVAESSAPITTSSALSRFQKKAKH